MRKNCSSDREKLLKSETEGQEFAKFVLRYSNSERSEEFLVTNCFFNLFLQLGCRNMQETISSDYFYLVLLVTTHFLIFPCDSISFMGQFFHSFHFHLSRIFKIVNCKQTFDSTANWAEAKGKSFSAYSCSVMPAYLRKKNKKVFSFLLLRAVRIDEKIFLQFVDSMINSMTLKKYVAE